MNAVLSFPIGYDASEYMERFPLPCSAAEVAFECAVDEFVTREAMAGWLESADGIREPSKYFGPISNDELCGELFKRSNSDERRAQAAILLHKRFVDEHMEEIRRTIELN